MHVAYLADSRRIGGAERYLADIAAGAVAAGYEATVVAPQPALLEYVCGLVPAVRCLRAGSDDYYDAPSQVRRAALLARTAPAVARAVGRADLLHVNNGGYPGADLCRLVPILRRRGAPRVMSVHSVPWERHGSRVQAAVDAALWHSLDAVLGATAVVGEELVDRREMPARLFRRLPYGMSEPEPGDAGLRRRLAPDGELLVGMVAATADRGKGHAVLRDAIEMAGDGVRGVLVGADPGFEHSRITAAGWVDSVSPYLRAVDVLAVPSIEWESLPLVVLEAMAAAKPVYGSRLAGIPEAVLDGETGRLFAPGDAAALAELLRSAERSDLERMGAAGRERWASRYSPDVMVRGVLGIYAELGCGTP